MARYTLLEIWRPRPEWYALPKQQKEKFCARGREVLGEILGKDAKVLGIYKIRAASSDGWDVMGYWDMPSFDQHKSWQRRSIKWAGIATSNKSILSARRRHLMNT